MLDLETTTRLLGSIEADRLVLMCGAGLSIPDPSHLMLAQSLARVCYDKYQPLLELPEHLRDDLDLLAGHFYEQRELVSVFIGGLVPWNELTGSPNRGHAAVADFLICRALTAAFSANFDALIEHWASERKVAMRGALDGSEAEHFNTVSNSLLKFHGCINRSREATLWTHRQFDDEDIAARLDSCKEWIRLKLQGRDLLVVGFWSDWAYLNDVLGGLLGATPIGAVTVIDPDTSANLETKSPGFWEKLHELSDTFTHVQASSDEALNHLRLEYSKSWVRKLYLAGKPLYEAMLGECPVALLRAPDLDVDEYYQLRRDAEGVPYNRAATKRAPGDGTAQTALAHLLLLNANAERRGAWYELDGRTIRVVHGAGESKATVQEQYREPPAFKHSDIVICAGAIDTGAPGRIIASGEGASIARPGPGGSSIWWTLDEAREQLGV